MHPSSSPTSASASAVPAQATVTGRFSARQEASRASETSCVRAASSSAFSSS
jgi:hypothetical protein